MSRKAIVALATAMVASLVASPAMACKPAAYFTYESIEHDLPTCVTVDDYGDYEQMPLRVHNGCDLTLTLDAVDCPRCAEQTIEIEPHAEETEGAEFILEPTEPGQEQATFRHHLSWSMEDESGDIRTVVDYEDNSDACSGRIFNCSSAGGTSGATGLLVVLAMGAWRRRRRG